VLRISRSKNTWISAFIFIRQLTSNVKDKSKCLLTNGVIFSLVKWLPRRHGFLTNSLKEYLKNERKTVDTKTRAVYDYHMREILKKSLDDVVFILENLDEKEFDKVASELCKNVDSFLSCFCKRYVDRAGLLYPMGRIKEQNIRVGFKRWCSGFESFYLITSLFQNAIDNAFGKGVFDVYVLSKDASKDYEKIRRDKA